MADIQVKGKLSPKNEALKSRYAGHRVRVEFDDKLVNADNSALTFRRSVSAEVESEGGYFLLLDERVLADETAILEVRSPLGARIFSDSLTKLVDQDRIRVITVDPELPFQISSHPDPLKGKRVRFTGRLLDTESKQSVANRQVLIFAVPAGAADEDLETANVPVFAGRTNNNGYFSGDHPGGTFAAAIAEVDGVRTPLRLESDGSFPLRLVLVVALPPDTATANGQTSPPRAPDEEDLLNAPELFSNDLGVGSCVDFTIPNRTLEEIPFYKIVRTTDPEIKGTSLEPPIKVFPDFDRLLRQLAFGQATIDSKLKVRPEPSETIGRLNVSRDTLLASREVAMPRTVAADAAVDATRARISPTLEKPSLAALETHGVATVGEWRDTVETKSIEVALQEALPTLSAETLRSVLVDPDEFTPVSLMTAERLSTHQLVSELVRVVRKPVAGRAELNEANPVDWDDTPTFYQATNIAHGHILQFRQVWKADGYSLGDLLHSIPLAPCQKKQIVTIDWDRREDAVRTEDLTEREFLFANLVRDRDVKEMIDTALSEEIDGGSTAKTYGGGGGLGFSIGPLVIGASGGGSGADSEAWQDSSRQISAETMHEVKDRINQSAAAVRSQRATVVQTLGQGERTRVETEVIANHNHCHALTMQYFEVLRHFQVTEELAEVRECLFVPFLMSRFHDEKVLRWRDALVRNCLKRKLRPAFEAIDRIQLNYLGSDLPPGMFAEEPLESLDGELRVRITIARPRDPRDDETDYFERVWPFWTRLIGGNPADVYDRFLQNQQFKDRIFREQLAPEIAEKFIASLRVVLFTDDGAEVEANLDPTLASKYRVGETHTVTLADSGNTPTIPRRNIVGVEIRTDYELPEHSQVIVETAAFLYTTRHLRHPLYQNSRVLDDLLFGDPVFFSTSRLTKEEERNPRAEDQELRRNLLAHLNANLEYYHKAMWWTLDKERRFILLDGFLAPHSGGRSVASVVHNDLIGIVGNSLVFPVVAGFQLDPRYRALLDQADPEKPPPNLLDLYAPISPNPPRLLSVPTKGVFAEAVMGACNSCEKIDDSRFWRWSESPCPDDPPAIAPVNVTSRAGAVPDLTATDFPAPIVNFQNIPEAPDPTGLAAALNLLGRGDVFRDITGLTQNQKNALATLQASLSTAGAFGQEAIQLAHAEAAERNIDQTLNSVFEAKQDGRLTDEAARAVMKGALQNFLGQQGQQSTSVVDSAGMKEALGAALEADKGSVTITEEKAGEQSTVEVSKEGPGAEGQAVKITFETITDNMIEVEAIHDGLIGNAYKTPGTKSWEGLRSVMIQLDVPGQPFAVDWRSIGENGKFIEQNGSGFKVRADLHICFPDSLTANKESDPKLFPIVVMLHGQNSAWLVATATRRKLPDPVTDAAGVTKDVVTMDAAGQLESFKGFAYLQSELATHGIVSVSINCNFANRINSWIRLRSEILFACLDALRQRKDGQFAKYFGKLDFTKIGVMGHSRGGDAAFDAVKRRKRPGFEYGIKALGLIAPPDGTGSVDPANGRIDLNKTDGVSLFMLYGSQDGDVTGEDRTVGRPDIGGTPFRHYDRAPAPKVLAYALGCSHTAFNQIWTNFPERDLLTKGFRSANAGPLRDAKEHRELAKEYLTAFFRCTLTTLTPAEQNQLRKLFNGLQENSQKIPVALQWDFGTVVRVDDNENQKNNLNGDRTLVPTGTNIMTGAGFSPRIANSADPLDLNVWQQTFAIVDAVQSSSADELIEDLRVQTPAPPKPRNLTKFDVLTFRMARDYDITSQTTIDSAPFPVFTVTLVDVNNARATVDHNFIYSHNVLAPNRPEFCEISLSRSGGAKRNATKIFFETFQVPLDQFTGILRNECVELVFKFGPNPPPMRIVIDDIFLVKF